MDIYYEIMLNMDIDEINKNCAINKNFYNICSNKYFWINKFKKDGLVVMTKQNSVRDWINEYITMKKVAYQVNYIFQWLPVRFELNISFKKLYKIEEMENDLLWIENELDVNFVIFKDGAIFIEYNDYENLLSKNQLYQLLYKIFYYYPENDISIWSPYSRKYDYRGPIKNFYESPYFKSLEY